MRILWICLVWPEPNSSAAGARTAALMQACVAAKHELHVVSACQSNSYMTALEELGISTSRFELNDSSIENFLKSYAPDCVIFDRFMIEEQYSFRVRACCPDALRILDTVDLHLLRKARQRIACAPGGEQQVCYNVSDTQLEHVDTLRELAAIYRSDYTVVVSDAEREFLIDRLGVPRSRIVLSSMLYGSPRDGPDFSGRRHFVAIGNLSHPPNEDSFKILATEIWPRLRSLLSTNGQHDVELHCYGAYPTARFEALSDLHNGLIVKGRAHDAQEVLSKYRVNLAPLRFGAGVKGKVADGWSVGTPCVATTIAAEGMYLGDEFGGLISNQWEEFAANAALLYLDEQRWRTAQAIGQKALTLLFDAQRNADALLKILQPRGSAGLLKRDTWITDVLWQQQFRSTEYFARWIEEKNRGR